MGDAAGRLSIVIIFGVVLVVLVWNLKFHIAEAQNMSTSASLRIDATRKSVTTSFLVGIVGLGLPALLVGNPWMSVIGGWLSVVLAAGCALAWLVARPAILLHGFLAGQATSTGPRVNLIFRLVMNACRSEVRRADIRPDDALKNPSTALWYSAKAGRYLLLGLLLIVIVFAAATKVFLQDDAQFDVFRNWSALFGIAFVFSAAAPLALTWVLTVAVTGQPRFRHSLQRIRGCAGMGTSFGLILAIAAFFYLNTMPVSRVEPILPFTIQTFLSCATLGTVTGLTIGMFAVTFEAALLIGNRYGAAVFTILSCAIASIVTAFTFSPRQVLARMIDGVTAGTIPVDLGTLESTSDWKLILVSGKSEFVDQMMGTGWFIGTFVAIATVFVGSSLMRWRRAVYNGNP